MHTLEQQPTRPPPRAHLPQRRRARGQHTRRDQGRDHVHHSVAATPASTLWSSCSHRSPACRAPPMVLVRPPRPSRCAPWTPTTPRVRNPSPSTPRRRTWQVTARSGGWSVRMIRRATPTTPRVRSSHPSTPRRSTWQVTARSGGWSARTSPLPPTPSTHSHLPPPTYPPVPLALLCLHMPPSSVAIVRGRASSSSPTPTVRAPPLSRHPHRPRTAVLLPYAPRPHTLYMNLGWGHVDEVSIRTSTLRSTPTHALSP